MGPFNKRQRNCYTCGTCRASITVHVADPEMAAYVHARARRKQKIISGLLSTWHFDLALVDIAKYSTQERMWTAYVEIVPMLELIAMPYIPEAIGLEWHDLHLRPDVSRRELCHTDFTLKERANIPNFSEKFSRCIVIEVFQKEQYVWCRFCFYWRFEKL